MVTVGVDIGGTTLKAGLVDASGSILSLETSPTPGDLPALLASIEALLDSLGRQAPFERVGLGIPGLRAAETGRMEASPNLPYLNGVNIEVPLADAIGKPVVGRNDAEMHTWGEFKAGAGVGTHHMVGLTLGTGVGSGLVVGGQLYSGSLGYAPEAGHLVVQEDGLPCPCGGRGCLETVASATGIVEAARRRFSKPPPEPLPKPLSAKSLHELAVGGQARAIAVFETAGRFLGIACTDLMNLLNPEVIVIGGGVAQAGALLLEPLIAEARVRTFRSAFEACRIVPAKLGSEAGVVGAGLLAQELA